MQIKTSNHYFPFKFFKAIIYMNKIHYDYHIYPLFLLPHSF